MLILNSVAFHFLVWGPRGIHKSYPMQNPYLCCRFALSLAFLTAGKKKHSPFTALLFSHLFLVSTPFSPRVPLMHALSLIDNYIFLISASPTHDGSAQCRVYVMGYGGMISGTSKTDK
ncbi:hypothetical protein N7517_005794 [Penicillium concentricum]|uniref:Uncharacterized protein n=1 Tax=Penicillium concentricum TaxID=293559 RepID=A0A9W9S887_9EURO|nr:uncharacterized protein N7517_005794 [Penicillium concentricum]KAJ5373788.1 hypothetical protein N7517_005794 [Penicillium concentricum]